MGLGLGRPTGLEIVQPGAGLLSESAGRRWLTDAAGLKIEVTEIGGFLWPAADQTCGPAVLAQVVSHIPALLDFVPGRNLVIQAGGNVGVYPKKLAAHFAKVATFEPDPANFLCLCANLVGVMNVGGLRAALGAERRSATLERWPGNVGAHRIVGLGAMPVGDRERFGVEMVKLDELYPLRAEKCDLIWLDIEGHEPQALAGGRELIERDRPVIIVEDKGLTPGGAGQTVAQIAGYGYREAAHVLRDYVMVPV